jgi:hypothetical protein
MFLPFRIYVEMMNRRQTQLQLVLLDLGCFLAVANDGDDDSQKHSMEISEHVTQSCNMWTLYEETSNVWINVSFCIDALYASAFLS